MKFLARAQRDRTESKGPDHGFQKTAHLLSRAEFSHTGTGRNSQVHGAARGQIPLSSRTVHLFRGAGVTRIGTGRDIRTRRRARGQTPLPESGAKPTTIQTDHPSSHTCHSHAATGPCNRAQGRTGSDPQLTHSSEKLVKSSA